MSKKKTKKPTAEQVGIALALLQCERHKINGPLLQQIESILQRALDV